MAAASVILVLAYVPYIDVKSFSPLGFDFREGGELSVWAILAGVLVYYGIRFSYECWTVLPHRFASLASGLTPTFGALFWRRR